MLRFIRGMVRYDAATELVHFVALDDNSQHVRFSLTRSALARRARVRQLRVDHLLEVFELYASEIHQMAACLYARAKNKPAEIMIGRIGSLSPLSADGKVGKAVSTAP
jgi:hypothetical protein